MKVLDYVSDEVELNANESAVYKSICHGDSLELGDDGEYYSGCHNSDISVKGLSIPQVKGYISALLKKEVIQEVELYENMMIWAVVMPDSEVERMGILK